MVVISNNKSFISKILKVVVSLGGKFDFFSVLAFKIESNFEYLKIKLYSFKARNTIFRNEKNLILGEEIWIETVSQLSALIFVKVLVLKKNFPLLKNCCQILARQEEIPQKTSKNISRYFCSSFQGHV